MGLVLDSLCGESIADWGGWVDGELVTNRGQLRQVAGVGEFCALAGSRLISMVGDTVAFVAVTVVVFQRTGSALLASLTFTVAFVPELVAGLLLASLVDRVEPRRLMVTADISCAGLVAVAALPASPVVAVFAAILGVGAIAPVRGGCSDVIVAEILGEDSYGAGRAVQRVLAQGSQIVGVALGGVLIVPLGPHGAMFVDTASFIASAAVVRVGLTHRPVVTRQASGVVIDSLAGTRQVWKHRPIRRRLLLGWLLAFVAVAPEALGAPAVAALGASEALVGVWFVAVPVGMVVGDLGAALWLSPQSRLRLVWPLATAIPGLWCLFICRPGFKTSIVLLVLSGVSSVWALGLDQSLRDATPPGLRGRAFTLYGTGLMTAQGIGFVVPGLLADLTSPSTAIAVTGSVGLSALAFGRATSKRTDHHKQ